MMQEYAAVLRSTVLDWGSLSENLDIEKVLNGLEGRVCATVIGRSNKEGVWHRVLMTTRITFIHSFGTSNTQSVIQGALTCFHRKLCLVTK